MAGGTARLRSVDGLISPDVAGTLSNLPDLTDADAAAVKLARLYAAQIDAGDPEMLEKLGPKLLACLESLGATPKARAARKGGASGGQGQGGKLAAIREARRSA